MPDLTKRERLEATIAGQKTDRPPVALWRHWPGDDQDAKALAAAHVKWQQDYDWDFIKVSPASSFCLVDWGVEDRWEGHPEGTRTYTKRVVARPDDWPQLPLLDPNDGMLAVQIETLKHLREAVGEEVPFIATIFSPLAQAKNLAGSDRALSHMRSHPALFLQGLETIAKSTLRYIEVARTTGISGIFYATQHARYKLMSEAAYKTFGEPFDEQILDAARDLWLNVLHLHGTDDVIFDLVADYDVPVLNWHDRDCEIDLTTGLDQLSGAASGGVSRDTMHLGTPREVLAEARQAMDQTRGERLILGTGCVIMTNTPLRNISALREFAG